MRGKVGKLIRNEMNRLFVLHYYRLKDLIQQNNDITESESLLKEPNILSLPSSGNWLNIFEVQFFQTLIHFFCSLLIFVKKVLKATIFELNKTILLISSLTLKNMSNRFFVLFTLFFFIFFFKTRFFRDSWGVNSALSQTMHIFCKKMQRNRLLKLTQSHL